MVLPTFVYNLKFSHVVESDAPWALPASMIVCWDRTVCWIASIY